MFLQQIFNCQQKRNLYRIQQIFLKNSMEKYTWRQVKTLSSSSHKPSARWGHSCCVVGEDIVFFGGYADSNYMNDVWAFNSVTMKWRQIETKGDTPAQRSNCSMNYDKQNNQIVIFGGGGANKQRFNSISILNWANLQWIEIAPKQNEVAPWERTYHVAQLIYPYLVVFGGEGVADMDDLWVFNFITLSWTEIKTSNDKVKPCARRFHSSVRLGNEFVIMAGCHSKYRCLSDFFSMDFTPLLKTGKIDQLEWKQKKIKNSSLLTRWGHTSTVYDNKIYIFGGRFSNDLNDLLVADFEKSTIRQLKIAGEAPAARRRHCAGFIGSSMLTFGGFNGQYFNDLHYISVHEPKSKYEINQSSQEKQILKFINNKAHANYSIKTVDNKELFMNAGILYKYFDGDNELGDFLESLQDQYRFNELEEMLTVLYLGYRVGEAVLNEEIRKQLKYPIFESRNEKLIFEKESIEKPNLEDEERKMLKKSAQGVSQIIKLNEEAFAEYFLDLKSRDLFDFELSIGKNRFTVNRTKIMARSQFFMSLFSSQPSEEKIILPCILGQQSRVTYEVFFNFLETDWLIMPGNVSTDTYENLILLGDYFCVPSLVQLCANQLMAMVSTANAEHILRNSISMKLVNLTKACCDFWIKKASETVKIVDIKVEINKTFGDKKVVEQLQNMLAKIGFDLAQTTIQNEKPNPSFVKKAQSSNFNMEKQNYETNVYNQ